MVRNNELKRIRLEHKTSQSLLATIAGVSARSISRYENGTQMPNIEAALRIAAYYNMMVEQIFPPKEYMPADEYEGYEEILEERLRRRSLSTASQ